MKKPIVWMIAWYLVIISTLAITVAMAPSVTSPIVVCSLVATSIVSCLGIYHIHKLGELYAAMITARTTALAKRPDSMLSTFEKEYELLTTTITPDMLEQYGIEERFRAAILELTQWIGGRYDSQTPPSLVSVSYDTCRRAADRDRRIVGAIDRFHDAWREIKIAIHQLTPRGMKDRVNFLVEVLGDCSDRLGSYGSGAPEWFDSAREQGELVDRCARILERLNKVPPPELQKDILALESEVNQLRIKINGQEARW